jgi:hypothetical protein
MPESKLTRIPCVCEGCGAHFGVRPSEVRRGGGRFCTQSCYYSRCDRTPCVCDVCGCTFHALPSAVRRGRTRYCSAACYHEHQKIDVDIRFCKYISVPDETGCVIWTGCRNRGGYGILAVKDDGRNVLAHRYSYMQRFGQVPSGLFVLHRCDVRACVNPDHLFLGTLADNAADKVAKGRQPRGEDVGGVKLTADQVVEIRARYAAGGILQKQLAAEFGVAQTLISQIVSLKIWKHV